MPLFKYDVSSIGQLGCLDRNSNAFQHLWNKFGFQKSEAKIKEGVFVQQETEADWWEPFMQVVQNILGNHKDAEVVDNFLHSYIDFFFSGWGMRKCFIKI